MKPLDTITLSFAVRRLFSRGSRLDLRVVGRSPAIVGTLELVTLRYAGHQPVRVLELRDCRHGIQPRLIPSLYDPQLYALGSLGALIGGTEKIETGGNTTEYTQEWHVQFVVSDAGGGTGGTDGIQIDTRNL